MGKRGGLLLLALLLAPLPALGQGEPAERESEYEMPAGEAWALPGFRVQLRFGRDSLTGAGDGAPDASGWSFAVEPGIRLSESFSLAATLRYAALIDGFEGVRYSTSGEFAWHPFGGFFLGTGVGYAGLVGSSAFGSCDGDGVMLLARTGWLIPVGELFATGPVVQLDQQWTSCSYEEEFFEEDEEWGNWTYRTTERTWSHRTLHFSWSLAWR